VEPWNVGREGEGEEEEEEEEDEELGDTREKSYHGF
jgi:hypothetical protein